MSRQRPSRERGFTLVEVVIVVALLGVVSVAIGGALWFGIRASQDNSTILDQSMASQAVTRFLDGDIYAAEGVSTTATCGTADLKLVSRSNAADTGVADVVTAWQWTPSSTTLERRVCKNGVVQSTLTVARNIDQFTVTAGADGAYTVAYRAVGSNRVASVTRTVRIEPVISREAP